MAVTLTGAAVKDTYKDLLHLANANAGVSATRKQLYDGNGTATNLWLATSGLYGADNAVAGVVPFINVTHAAYGAVPGADSTAAIQAAIDAANTAGGGIVYVPWPNGSPYVISGTGIKTYSHVQLLGGGEPGTDSDTAVHFAYTGNGACVWNSEGHADTAQTKHFGIENIGIRLDTAGNSTTDLATGVRIWRTSFARLHNIHVRIKANNCCAVHFKSERNSGTFQGTFKGHFTALRSQNSGSRTGVRHFMTSGSSGDGQFNANFGADWHAINEGRAFWFGPGTGNVLYALSGEGQGPTDNIVRLDDNVSYSSFFGIYMERAEAKTGTTKDIFCNTNSDNVHFYNVTFAANTALADCTLRAESTIGDGQDVYRGAGGSDPPWAQYTENGWTTRSHTLSGTTITPNLNNGLHQYLAVTGNLTINNPTGRLSGVSNTLDLDFDNTASGSSRTIGWGSQYVVSPTSVGANKRVLISLRFDAVNTKWVQRAAAQELP